MSAPPASLGAITLFVEDPKRSKAFYERVFGLAAVYEDDDATAFKFENTVINLLAYPAARSLIAPGTVAGAGADASFQLTIWVEDTDATCKELEARGVTLLNGPIDREWGLRTGSFEDPDGHIWEVAAELPSRA